MGPEASPPHPFGVVGLAGAIAAALLAATLIAPPAAAEPTGSIVFTRDDNVWIMAADDPSTARAVTSDGTAAAPYLTPSQDDHGRIVVVQGGEGGDVVRIDQQGNVLNGPFAVEGGNFQDLDVRGDGEVFTYTTYRSYDSGGGTFVVAPTVDFAYADGRDPAPVANPAFDKADSTYSTDQAFVIDYDDDTLVPWVATYGPGSATLQNWFMPCTTETQAGDEGEACFPTMVDVTTAQDRVVVALPAVDWWPVGSRLYLFEMAGPPPAAPTFSCELIGPDPDVVGTEVSFRNPEWSPDGSALVYEQVSDDDGSSELFLATDLIEGCDDGIAEAVSLGAGGAPDWSPAALGAAPGPDPDPEPTDPEPTDPEPTDPPGGMPQPTPVDPLTPAGVFDGNPSTTERVNVSDPFAISFAISRSRFADAGAGRVVLSRNDTFPDSLAGATLTVDGPLLFTMPTGPLHRGTRAEIERVLAPGGTVHILGGVNAVPQEVEDELTAAGYVVDRLAGPSRVETAIAVADLVRQLIPGQSVVGLARAAGPANNPTAGWADSVTGGAWGAATGVPILVTDTAGVHPAVAAWLQANAPSQTVLFGGTAALSDAVADAVPNPARIAASERTGTAAAIATSLWGATTDGPRRFTILDGFRDDGWAFGLAAAGMASDAGAPLLMVNGDIVPESTASLVTGCDEVDLALSGSGNIITQAAGMQLDALDDSC